MPKPRHLRAPLLGILGLLLLLVWLLFTQSGLQATLAWLAGPRLTFEAPQGRLAGPLQLGRLHWQADDGSHLEITEASLDWSPLSLLGGKLRINQLTVARIDIQPGVAAKSPPPTDLTLPVAVDLHTMSISRINYRAWEIASDLRAHFESDGRHHQLTELEARRGPLQLNASAELAGTDNLPLQLQGELRGTIAEQAIHLAFTATGPLAHLALRAEGKTGLGGEARAIVTPFADHPLRELQLALDNLNPALWQDGWPQARLALRGDLRPQEQGIVGELTLSNQEARPLDRDGLPFTRLSGQLHWQDKQLALSELRAELTGGGSLTGQAAWQGGTSAELKLHARQLDLARLDSRLRSTRLDGPIFLTLANEQQRFRLALVERKLQLRAEGEHTAKHLHLPLLEIAVDEARLQAQGKLALNAPGTFDFSGKLRNFSPNRLLQATTKRLPELKLNGEFSIKGQRQPQLAAELRLQLTDSLIGQQPLSGEAQGRILGERLLDSKLQLAAGANRLRASGGFGQAGDLLEITLEAEQLALIGLEGSLNARIELRGNRQHAQWRANADSARVGIPGLVRLSGLKLSITGGNAPAAEQALDLQLARIDTTTLPPLARKLNLTLRGRRDEHRITGEADLLEGNRLQLALQGALDDSWRWQGKLLTATLESQDKTRNFRLAESAPLHLAPNAWQIGPLQLAGEQLDWQARLAAHANDSHLNGTLQASGRRIGQLDGELSAGLLSAWQLKHDAPWHARLNALTPDLGWLGATIGSGWQTGGRLETRLEIGGTPAATFANGRFRGENLILRLPEQGLSLVNGRLVADLRDNRLRIGELTFESPLQAAPRPLRLASKTAASTLATLTATPGRLEIRGELRVDRDKGEAATLAVRLERIGAWQLPDQWLLVSGDGRINWHQGVLGVHGRLTADAGYWQLAPGNQPRLSDDITVIRPGRQSTSTPLRPRLDLDLVTDLGQHFLFAGAGLNSHLSGEVRLTARERDLPRASGSILTRDGRFEAYGQKLDIERGALNFNGLLDNPALDVRAVRKGLSVEPGVQIGGTARKPVIRLVSDPDLPDPEKLAWLVLGHGPESMGSGDAPLLLAAAGGLLGNDSGNLLGQIRKTFGIDELGIRQGQIGDSGGRQPSSRIAASTLDTSSSTGNQIFSIGKRLSSNALLSYEQALGKAESVVKLTVNLTRNVSVVGRAGSDNALDVFYTLLFGKPERPTAP